MKSTMNPMHEIGLGEPGSVLTRPQAVGMAGELSRVASPSARTGKPETCATVIDATMPGERGTGLFSSSYPGFPASISHTGTCTLRPDSQRDHRWSNQPKFQAA